MTRIQTLDADRFPLSGGRGHTRDAVPLLRADLARIDPVLRSGVAESVNNANALIMAHNMAHAARTRDDILEGNPARKSYALGQVYTATAEELRDLVTDPVSPLQAGKNFVLAEILGPEDVEDYEGENGPGPVINLGHAYPQGVKDALSRARAGRDQGAPRAGLEPGALIGTSFSPGTQAAELARYRKPGDSPPMKGVNPPSADAPSWERPCEPEKTKDGRAMRVLRNYLPGSNRGITAAQYAENLRAGRETRDQTAPVSKARVTGAEYAANLAADPRNRPADRLP